MVFIYDEETWSVHDPEKKARIKYCGDYREKEAHDQMTYLFTQEEKEFKFEVAFINVLPTDDYKPAYAKDYVASEENNAKAGQLTTFILEDSFQEGKFSKVNGARMFLPAVPVCKGLEAVYQNLQDSFADINQMKEWLKEGFYNLVTEGLKRLTDLPGEKYIIEFEKNIASAAAKNPGKFPLYENWVRAYGKVPAITSEGM